MQGRLDPEAGRRDRCRREKLRELDCEVVELGGVRCCASNSMQVTFDRSGWFGGDAVTKPGERATK